MSALQAVLRGWSRVLSSIPPGRRRWAVVALLGWWLSPLTAWNDAFTNIPLSIAVVFLLRAAGWPLEPKLASVVVYIITNVAGLLMLWIGLGKLSWVSPRPAGRGGLWRIVLRVAVYAALVFATVWSLERILPVTAGR